MARINLPTSSEPQALVNNVPYDQGYIARSQQATIEGFNQLVSTTFGEARALKSRHESAQMAAAQAESQMFSGIFSLFKGISDTVSNAERQMQQIQWKQEDFETDRKNNLYELVEGTKLKIALSERMGMMKDQKGGKPNPLLDTFNSILGEDGVSPIETSASGRANPQSPLIDPVTNIKWIDEYGKEVLSRAPSPEAALNMLSKLAAGRLSLVKDSYRLKNSAEQNSRLQGYDANNQLIIADLKDDPYQDSSYHESMIDQSAELLKQEGIPNEAIREYTLQNKNKLFNGKIEGHLKNNDLDGATKTLEEGIKKQFIDPASFEKQRGAIIRKSVQLQLETDSKVKGALALQADMSGDLIQGAPGQEQASMLKWSAFQMKHLNNTQNTRDIDVPVISKMITTYYQNTNTVSKGALDNIKTIMDTSENPNEVAAFAKGIYDLSEHDITSSFGRKSANLIAENNKELYTQALFIGNRISAGRTPAQAVQEYRQLTDVKNVEVNKIREERFKELEKNDSSIKPGSIYSSLIGKDRGFFEMFSKDAPIENLMAEQEAYTAIRDTYMLTGDMEVAKAAGKDYLKRNYYSSDINGKRQPMKMAPELYYSGETLTKFKQGLVEKSKTLLGSEYELVAAPVKPDYTAKRQNIQKALLGLPTDNIQEAEIAYSDNGFVFRHKETGREKIVKIAGWEGITNHPSIKQNELRRMYVFTNEDGSPIMSVGKDGQPNFETYSLYFDNADYKQRVDDAYNKAKALDEVQSDENVRRIEQEATRQFDDYAFSRAVSEISAIQKTAEKFKDSDVGRGSQQPAEQVQKGNVRNRVQIDPSKGPASLRYNNPGAAWPSKADEKYGAEGYGVLKDGNKIAKFPTPIHGGAANMDLFYRNYQGLTVAEALKKWRGGNPGSNVIPKGVDPNMKITKDVLKNKEFMIQLFMSKAKHEGGGKTNMSKEDWEKAYKMFAQNNGIE